MDKENELNLNKIKELEEKLESDRLALKQKDIDIDDLNSKLKSKTQDSDNSQIEVNDLRDKLDKCNIQKSEVDSRLFSMLIFF
jgi:chromosome segregation ATPase